MRKNKLFGLCVLAASTVLTLGSCNSVGGGDTSGASSSTAPSEVHVHTPDSTWHYDENKHWHVCTSCNMVIDEAAHALSAAVVDAVAGTDGYTKHSCDCGYHYEDTTTHKAGTEWKYDKTSHWHTCIGCTDVMGKEAHTFTDTVVEPTDETNGYTLHTCACGYSYKDNETVKKYDVTFNGGDYAYAIGLPEKAKKGETVSFKVTVESGYQVDTVKAVSGDTEITLNGTVREGYTFTMPGDAVSISVSTLGAYFAVNTDSDKVVVDVEYQYGTDKKLSDFVAGYIVDGVMTKGTSLYARAGATVNVLTNYVGIADNVKYTLDGAELAEGVYVETTGEGEDAVTKKYSVVTFVMPNHSVNLDVTATEREFEIQVDAPDYVISSIYTKDSDGNKTEITKKKGNNNTAYVAFTFDGDHDNGNYKISEASYTYQERSGYEIKDEYTSRTSSLYVSSDGSYSLSIGSYTSYYGPIVVKPTVLEAIYTDATWTGTYTGKEIYGSVTTSGSQTAVADAFGTLKLGTTSYTISGVSTSEADSSTVLAFSKGSTANWAYVDGDLMLTSYYPSRSTFTASDVYLMVKGYTSTTGLNYSYDEGGSMDDKKAIRITVKDSEGNEIGNFVKVKTDFYLNVDIEFDDGYTAVNNSSNFTVKKNGVTLKHCEFVTTGE